jgi:hypothetical protein
LPESPDGLDGLESFAFPEPDPDAPASAAGPPGSASDSGAPDPELVEAPELDV